MGIKYPTADEIVEINMHILQQIKEKKADKHGLVDSGKGRIEGVLKEVTSSNGDIYEKAVILLSELVKKHPFVSGNRRTAFIVAENFLKINGETPSIYHDPRALQGVREGFYSSDEIKNWLKGGDIREFKR